MNQGSTETTFMGIETRLPVFISPAAMAKLGHPLGELNLTKAAGECGIAQAISANASCAVEELFEARKDETQPLIFQVRLPPKLLPFAILKSWRLTISKIYLNKDRSASEALLRKVEKLGARGIMFTVDTSWDSKRTLDERTKRLANSAIMAAKPTNSDTAPAQGLPVGKAISGYQDHNLSWSDIAFIRKNTTLPIIVKGVQCVEDVQLAVEHGVDGVLLVRDSNRYAPDRDAYQLTRHKSNHGGRQADYAPAPIDILYELRVLRPEIFSKIDVMIDGGVRSGADVVKALALGAKAVGLGRPFLYANGTHGQEGVTRAIQSKSSILSCGNSSWADTLNSPARGDHQYDAEHRSEEGQ